MKKKYPALLHATLHVILSSLAFEIKVRFITPRPRKLLLKSLHILEPKDSDQPQAPASPNKTLQKDKSALALFPVLKQLTLEIQIRLSYLFPRQLGYFAFDQQKVFTSQFLP